MNKQRGFTLIELLVVVAIIGILAAIAIPNFLNAVNRSRQKRTMADIRTIASAWEARASDVNHYTAAGTAVTWPEASESIAGLEGLLIPTYIKKIPVYDGWDAAFRIGSRTDSYTIESLGRDKFDEDEPQGSVIVTNNFDCDLIFSDGTFVKYPQGSQSQ